MSLHQIHGGILLVEDDAQWRYIIRLMIEVELQVTPLMASSAEEALKIMDANFIQVLITDYHMPETNGRELLKKVRHKYPNTKVVIISDLLEAFNVTSEQLVEEGASVVLPKDKLYALLAVTIRKLKE